MMEVARARMMRLVSRMNLLRTGMSRSWVMRVQMVKMPKTIPRISVPAPYWILKNKT